MPRIERICACGHRWDDLVGVVREPADAACPRCGGTSLTTGLGTFALDVCGTERMSAADLAAAYDNKRAIERDASRIQSGEVAISQSSRVPLELRPEIPKRFH